MTAKIKITSLIAIVAKRIGRELLFFSLAFGTVLAISIFLAPAFVFDMRGRLYWAAALTSMVYVVRWLIIAAEIYVARPPKLNDYLEEREPSDAAFHKVHFRLWQTFRARARAQRVIAISGLAVTAFTIYATVVVAHRLIENSEFGIVGIKEEIADLLVKKEALEERLGETVESQGGQTQGDAPLPSVLAAELASVKTRIEALRADYFKKLSLERELSNWRSEVSFALRMIFVLGSGFFAVKVLLGIYRYNVRLAVFFDGFADSLELNAFTNPKATVEERMKDLLSAQSVVLPKGIEPEPLPPTPHDQLTEIAKANALTLQELVKSSKGISHGCPDR